MPLMKITGPGLVAIACSVALLWACILGERTMLRRAYAERAAVMRAITPRQGGHRAEPVLGPGIRPPRPQRPAAG
jgi:hypothetical protein